MQLSTDAQAIVDEIEDKLLPAIDAKVADEVSKAEQAKDDQHAADLAGIRSAVESAQSGLSTSGDAVDPTSAAAGGEKKGGDALSGLTAQTSGDKTLAPGAAVDGLSEEDVAANLAAGRTTPADVTAVDPAAPGNQPGSEQLPHPEAGLVDV